MIQIEHLSLFIMASLAGLGLILLGTRLLSEGLQVIIGTKIRKTMNRLGESPWQSIVVGGSTSFMIQSRISAAVMAVSYAGSGLMNLRQLTLFLTGTAVGTVVTPWIFLLDTGRMDLVLLAVGILPMLYARWDQLSGLGRVAFSLGLMLLGFDIIAFGSGDPDALLPLFQSIVPALGTIGHLSYWSLIGIALCFSFIFRSTVALVALTMALVFAGLLNSDAAVVLTFGFNLGATVPAIMTSRRSTLTAQRGVLIFFVNYFLAIIVMSLFFENCILFIGEVSSQLGAFSPAGSLMFSSVASVPLSHVFINLLAVVISLLCRPLSLKFCKRILPEPQKKQPQQLLFLGRPSHLAPSLAIEQANQEVKKLSAMVHSMLGMTQDLFAGKESSEERVKKYENITDNILDELTVFIAKVMQASLSKKQSFEAACLLQTAIELEKIADCCEDIIDYYMAPETQGKTPEEINSFLNSAIESYEHIFPLLTDQFRTNKEAVHSFVEDLDEIIRESVKVYDALLEKGLRQRDDYERSLVAVNSIRRIIEGSRNIIDLQHRFNLSGPDLERA